MENIMLPSGHKILRVLKETKAEYTFRVAYDGATDHGQFFQLSIPKIGEAPISVSGRGEGYVEFTIRKIGRLTDGIFGLNAGDTLFMRGPYGKAWPVGQFRGKDLVVICGGTHRGVDTALVITPCYSANILETVVHEFLCKPFDPSNAHIQLTF